VRKCRHRFTKFLLIAEVGSGNESWPHSIGAEVQVAELCDMRKLL